jgi:hypothetical protein
MTGCTSSMSFSRRRYEDQQHRLRHGVGDMNGWWDALVMTLLLMAIVAVFATVLW